MKLGKKKKISIVMLFILIILLIATLGIYFYLDSIKHIGVWQHELKVYNDNNELIRDELIYVELKEDNTFTYNLTDKIQNLKIIELSGIYIREKKKISLIYEDELSIYDEFYLKKDILYFYEDNINKFLTKDEINILEIPEVYNEITYDDYLNLLTNKEKAIVVVGNKNCYYCQIYKNETIVDIYSNYELKFYHVDSNGNWENFNLNGTPTTYFLENGEVIETVFGYVDYSSLNNTIKNINFWQ